MKIKRIKVEEWRITVTEGIMDAIHYGGGRRIVEFYIPDHEIAFNIDGIAMETHVFKIKKGQRYESKAENYFHLPKPVKVGEHFVDKKFVDFLEEYLKLKSSLFVECSKAIGEFT